MLQENLRALRIKKGLSQEELACRIHVVRQTVSKWETGLSVPDAQTLIQIAQVLETSVARLLDEEPPANNEKEADKISIIAEKLEQLNSEMARKNAIHRRKKRTGYAIAIVLSSVFLIILFLFAVELLTRQPLGPGVIGGADRPTGIFLFSEVGWPGICIGGILCIAVIILAGIFLHRTK